MGKAIFNISVEVENENEYRELKQAIEQLLKDKANKEVSSSYVAE